VRAAGANTLAPGSHTATAASVWHFEPQPTQRVRERGVRAAGANTLAPGSHTATAASVWHFEPQPRASHTQRVQARAHLPRERGEQIAIHAVEVFTAAAITREGARVEIRPQVHLLIRFPGVGAFLCTHPRECRSIACTPKQCHRALVAGFHRRAPHTLAYCIPSLSVSPPRGLGVKRTHLPSKSGPCGCHTCGDTPPHAGVRGVRVEAPLSRNGRSGNDTHATPEIVLWAGRSAAALCLGLGPEARSEGSTQVKRVHAPCALLRLRQRVVRI
jgi:hypothetical protein